MQQKKAANLRDAWRDSGSPPCDHASIDQEYYLGSQTGDWVCTKCGACHTYEEFEQMRPK
jgi:hypothetical protein